MGNRLEKEKARVIRDNGGWGGEEEVREEMPEKQKKRREKEKRKARSSLEGGKVRTRSRWVIAITVGGKAAVGQ